MENLGQFLAHSTWIVLLLKATLVVAAGGFLSAMFANRAAKGRYRIWTGVFVVLALLPIVHFGFSGWKLPVVVEGAKDRLFKEMPVAVSKIQHGTPLSPVIGKSRPGTTGTISHQDFKPVSRANLKNEGFFSRDITFLLKSLSSPVILWGIWLFGVLFLLLRLVLGRVQAHRLFRHSFLLDDDRWSFVAQFVARKVGLHRSTAVAAHPKVPIPLTFGTARPVVMLPKSADEWTMERRQIVLLHEFAHIQRRDDLTRLAARAVAALYWFHPLAWVAFRRFKVEQEKSCDERVIQSGVRPSDYASHLVALARGVDRRDDFRPMALAGAATLGMARKPELEGRLSEILNHFPNKETGMKLKIAGTFFVIASGIMLAIQPVAKAMNTRTDPVVAVPAAPAKVAQTETPEKPAEPEKLKKAPKAPKAKKVMTKKIVTTVTDDGDRKVIIIKDGDKVQKIHIKGSDEGDNVIFLGDDGDKRHNVFFMKEFNEKYNAQMKAAMEELKQAMELLSQKKMDLAELNREMAKSMGTIKVDSAAVKAQLKETMARLDARLKAQMKQSETAMAKLKEANKRLAEEMKGQQLKWVEKHHEMDARRMEKMEKLEEIKAHKIEILMKLKDGEMEIREMKLKEIEEELAKKHDGKVMKWTVRVDEDDVDGDHDVKMFHGHKKDMFIHADGDQELKIKLKVGLKGLEKKERKAIDKALKKFKKDLPKGVKLDSSRDDNGISLDINVPKGTKLSDADQKKLDNAVEKLIDQIRDIKGDKEAEVREIHIKKK